MKRLSFVYRGSPVLVTRTRGGERTLYRELAELASSVNRSSSLRDGADRLTEKVVCLDVDWSPPSGKLGSRRKQLRDRYLIFCEITFSFWLRQPS